MSGEEGVGPSETVKAEEGQEVSDSEKCKYCLSPIDKSARICPKCRSYQGRFLGRLSYLASGLTIINTVSIIIVLIGLLVPAYKANFNLKAELSIYPTYSDGSYIDYVVVNSGNRSASPVLTSVTHKFPSIAGEVTTTSNLETDFSGVVIAPGNTMRFKSVVDSHGGIPPMSNPGFEIEHKNSKRIIKYCYIDVVYVDFDGEQKKASKKYGCLYQ